MPTKPDPFLADEENPEWTEEDTAHAKPFKEMFLAQFATGGSADHPPANTNGP